MALGSKERVTSQWWTESVSSIYFSSKDSYVLYRLFRVKETLLLFFSEKVVKGERQRTGTAGSEATARCSGVSAGAGAGPGVGAAAGVGHAVPQVAVQQSSPCESDFPGIPPPCPPVCSQCGRRDLELCAKVDRLSK